MKEKSKNYLIIGNIDEINKINNEQSFNEIEEIKIVNYFNFDEDYKNMNKNELDDLLNRIQNKEDIIKSKMKEKNDFYFIFQLQLDKIKNFKDKVIKEKSLKVKNKNLL